MFAKLVAAVFALSAVASAIPTPHEGGQCNTGPVQCCNSMQSTSDSKVTGICALLGISLDNVVGQVGMNCSPISAVGLGSGASCTQQPVCCENNNYNGLINIGCTPINISL